MSPDFVSVGYARLRYRALCIFLDDEPDLFYVVKREDVTPVLEQRRTAPLYQIDEEMTETPQKAGFIKKSKSGKALIFRLNGLKAWYSIPAGAIVSLLRGTRRNAPVSIPARGEAGRQVTLSGVRS